ASRIGAAGARVDVLHAHGAGGGAVALPELLSAAVIGGEEQGVADDREIVEVGAGAAGDEGLDHERPPRCPGAGTRVIASAGVGGAEHQLSSDGPEQGGSRPGQSGTDVLSPHPPAGSPVALPQLISAVVGVVGDEEEGSVDVGEGER